MAELPQELIFDILSRLPSRSICRFRCVCKSWNSLFSNPDFIAVHLQRRRNHHFYLLQAIECLPAPDTTELVKEYPIPIYRLIEDPDPSRSYQRNIFALIQEHKLDQPIYVQTPNPPISHIHSWCNGLRYLDVDVVGTINGLVCLLFNKGRCVVIWNPSTNQYYQTPDAEISWKDLSDYSYGFAEHNGHKVVRIAYKTSPDFPVAKVRAEVFDLRTKSWSEIPCPPQVSFSYCTCGTILKGTPYWPMDYDVDASEKSDSIISYNARQNIFSLFKRPDFEIGEEEFTWRIGTMGDALVTFVQKEDFSIDVWIKMDDLTDDKVFWRKHFSVGPVVGIENWSGCWKNGEFLVSDAHEYAFKKEMFLYDVWSRKAKVFPEIRPEDEDRWPLEVSIYSESLISPCY